MISQFDTVDSVHVDQRGSGDAHIHTMTCYRFLVSETGVITLTHHLSICADWQVFRELTTAPLPRATHPSEKIEQGTDLQHAADEKEVALCYIPTAPLLSDHRIIEWLRSERP